MTEAGFLLCTRSYFLMQRKKLKHILLCCSAICMKIPNVERTRDIKWTLCSDRCAVHKAVTAAQVDLMELHVQSSFNYANTKQTTRVIILTRVSGLLVHTGKTVTVIYVAQRETRPTSSWSSTQTQQKALEENQSPVFMTLCCPLRRLTVRPFKIINHPP